MSDFLNGLSDFLNSSQGQYTLFISIVSILLWSFTDLIASFLEDKLFKKQDKSDVKSDG